MEQCFPTFLRERSPDVVLHIPRNIKILEALLLSRMFICIELVYVLYVVHTRQLTLQENIEPLFVLLYYLIFLQFATYNVTEINSELPTAGQTSRHVSSYIRISSRHCKIFIYLFHHTLRTCKDILRNAKGPWYSGWETLLQRFSILKYFTWFFFDSCFRIKCDYLWLSVH